MSASEDRLGTDRILPLILRMALPATAAQFINLLYTVIDKVYIGHIPVIGTTALAGVSVTASVTMIISSLSSFASGGGAPLAAIALGAGDRKRAGKLLGNSFDLLILFSVVSAVCVLIFKEPILRFVGASNDTIGYADSYLTIYLMGTLFVQVSVGLNTFISCQGRPMIAMLSVAIGAVLNIALDPLFMFVLDMGVEGAALATVISQAVSSVWVMSFLCSGRASLRIKRENLIPDKRLLLSIAALGTAPFVLASTSGVVGMVLNSGLRDYGGDIYVSVLAVMQSSIQLVSVPITGFTQGAAPVISYNYGAGNTKRVKQCAVTVISIVASFNFVLILLMILFPQTISHVFTSDAELIALAAKTIPIFFAGMLIFGLQRACQNVFIALGQAKISSFIAILRKIILLVPLASILPRLLGVNGIFIAEAVSDATSATICTILFIIMVPKILKKRQKLVIESKEGELQSDEQKTGIQ